MTRPPYLRQGDKAAFIAPARRISLPELAPALRLLRSWGLEPVAPPGLFDTDGQLAGSDEARASLIQSLLDDPEVKALWCARGGYGTVRIIDSLDFSRFARQPKWIVGYSDITVLHSHIHRRLAIETLHATMPVNIPDGTDPAPFPAVETLRRALFGEPLSYSFAPHPLDRSGQAEGPVVGGNLSILYSLCGSPSSISTEGKILFIEDLDEYLYHLDRMMMNLKRCGLLARLAGLVVGQLSDMHDNAVPFGRNAEQIVRDAVAEYRYPVCFGFPAGHNGLENRALCLGRTARLAVAPAGSSLAYLP